MDFLQVSEALERSSIKKMALEDAKKMQASVIESSKRAGRAPPKYVLMELIGKGSYGRVYKGKDMASAAIVAVKIIDLDTSDIHAPKGDTYAEFLKEIKALKTLSEVKARNINHVVDAFPVDQTMWMVTEYCGGGSVATLMRPSTPNGLREQWIIPILREVAEAMKWVHQSGLIHRDIKCANVLITEEGQVQLCDFGIAAPLETKVDKRSTLIGTPHWMAPELFDPNPSYGKEVDIWAFGAMAYEIATGLPPNALSGLTWERLGAHIRQRVPRLEGDEYSDGLKSIVAFCLQDSPLDRPSIESVYRHAYIYNTSAAYPTSSLIDLVKAFKLFEERGGSRKSLFNAGGAQAHPELSSTAQSDDNWNFSTTDAFDQIVKDSKPEDLYDVYGETQTFSDATPRPRFPQSRRRPPPEALAPIKGPLEKVFDPNTLTSYDENSKVHYGRMPPPKSDLPLRDDTAHASIRDTMIDLDGPELDGPSSFLDSDGYMETLKAGPRIVHEDYDSQDYNRPPLSDPADINVNRRTQDWKFPTMMPPASADPEVSSFGFNDSPDPYESDVRPPLLHHATEPINFSSSHSVNDSEERFSLIDLDLSLPVPLPRPSTANSDIPNNPFELERHASLYYEGPGLTPVDQDTMLYGHARDESPPIAPGLGLGFTPSHSKESSPDLDSMSTTSREYTTRKDDHAFSSNWKFPYDTTSSRNSPDLKLRDSITSSRGGQYHPHLQSEILDWSRVETLDHTDPEGRIWVKYEKYNGFWVPPWVKDREDRLDMDRPNRIKEFPQNAWSNFPEVLPDDLSSRTEDAAPSLVHLRNPKDPRRFTIEPWSKDLEQYIRDRDNASPKSGFQHDDEMDAAHEAIKAWNSHKSAASLSGEREIFLPSTALPTKFGSRDLRPRSHSDFPDVPLPPSVETMMGLASEDDLKLELDRLVGGLLTHLDAFKESYENLSRRK